MNEELINGEGAEKDSIGPSMHARDQDRHCTECGVKLSLYNPGPNCWQHTMGWPWRGPSARPRF